MTDTPPSSAQETPPAPQSRAPADPHEIAAANALRRSRRRWRIAAFAALAVMVVALAGRLVTLNSDAGEDHIARVAINGIIAHDPSRLRMLSRLAEDEHVKGVLITINSPGGTSAGGEELYAALRALGEDKPVVAVINELGASAAYMTAVAADRIYARRMSIVGSIGVYIQHLDASELLDTIGIGIDTIASGPLKGEPEYDEPMSPAVRESYQELIDDSYAYFVDVVAERRGLARPDTVELADGRILSGGMSLESGLIDGIGGETEAVAWLESENGLPEDLPVVTRYPLPPSTLERMLDVVGAQARAALGLPPAGAISLDGLYSLWQANL